jgi:hypothetical protein
VKTAFHPCTHCRRGRISFWISVPGDTVRTPDNICVPSSPLTNLYNGYVLHSSILLRPDDNPFLSYASRTTGTMMRNRSCTSASKTGSAHTALEADRLLVEPESVPDEHCSQLLHQRRRLTRSVVDVVEYRLKQCITICTFPSSKH